MGKDRFPVPPFFRGELLNFADVSDPFRPPTFGDKKVTN